MRFTIDRAGSPTPYYEEVPQDFLVPAIYFPIPEIDTRGETLNAYAMEYSWYIKFFHNTAAKAYELALRTITGLKASRNLVPLIGADGELTGKSLRIDDPMIKKLDNGAVQLTVNWTSRRAYEALDSMKIQDFVVSGWKKR